MDEILHHLETMGNRCLLAFTGESSCQGFLGGAGFCPSTVGQEACKRRRTSGSLRREAQGTQRELAPMEITCPTSRLRFLFMGPQEWVTFLLVSL